MYLKAGLFILLLGLVPFAVSAGVAHTAFGKPNANGIPATMDSFALRSSGTGFYVAATGYFVTASHVVDGCAASVVLRADGAQATQLVTIDRERDVAVLKASPIEYAPALTFGVPSAPARPFTMTRTKELGGLRSRETISARYIGVIHASNRLSVAFAVIAGTSVVGGNSGSPLTTNTGDIAGMVGAASTVDPAIGLAIDGRSIAHVLSDAHIPFVWHETSEPLSASLLDPNSYVFPIACYRAK